MSTKNATARKATAKRPTAAKKAGAKKRTASEASARKTGVRKTTARKSPVRKSPAKQAPTSKSAVAERTGPYTKPELRERLRARVLRGTKGGKAGQWGARKAQLLAHAYEAEGGGYKGARSAAQRHLQEWTHEE